MYGIYNVNTVNVKIFEVNFLCKTHKTLNFIGKKFYSEHGIRIKGFM